MKQMRKDVLVIAGVLAAAGMSGLGIERAWAAESWPIQDLYANKLKLDAEAEKVCEGSEGELEVDCIKDYHYTHAADSNFNLATKLMNRRAIIISAVNPERRTMRLIFNDRSLALRNWQAEAGYRLRLANLAVIWSLNDGSELSRFNDLIKLVPNEEVEVQFTGLEIPLERLDSRIYYNADSMMGGDSSYSGDTEWRYFDYKDCVNSEEYKVGMECALVYGEREGWASSGEELAPDWQEEDGGAWGHSYVARWPEGYELNDENNSSETEGDPEVGSGEENSGNDAEANEGEEGEVNQGGDENVGEVGGESGEDSGDSGDSGESNEDGGESGESGNEDIVGDNSDEGDTDMNINADNGNLNNDETGTKEENNVVSNNVVGSNDAHKEDKDDEEKGADGIAGTVVPKAPNTGGANGGASLQELENWTMAAAVANLGLAVVYWDKNRKNSLFYKKVKKS